MATDTLGGLAVGIMGGATPFLLYTGTASGLYAPIFVSFEQLGYEAFVMPGNVSCKCCGRWSNSGQHGPC